MHGGVAPVGVSRGVRLDALTSLRFFAAFAIVIEHSRGLFLSEHVLAAWPLDQAVSFFFVLSGFVLIHVYPDLPNKQAIVRFWLARVARIWPAHVVALIVLVLLAGSSQIHRLLGSDSAVIIIANLLLVHAWIPLRDFYFSLNAVSWTISTEMAFYLLFPVLILGFKSTWHWKLVAAAVLLVGLMVMCTVSGIPGYSDDYNGVTTTALLYISPLARLFEFVLGMCCGLWWHRVRPRLGSNVLGWTVAEVAAFAFALWCVQDGRLHMTALVQSSSLPAAQDWLVHASGCFGFAVLISVMASGTGVIGRALTFPLLIFLGEISYGIYLMHQVLIFGYSTHLEIMPPIPAVLEWPAYLAVLLVASSLSYFVLEQPLRAKIRVLGQRQKRQFQLAPVGDHSPSA